MYIYVYIHIHTHTHIYTHTCTYTYTLLSGSLLHVHINPLVFWPLKPNMSILDIFWTYLLDLKTRGLSGEVIANREIFRFHEP